MEKITIYIATLTAWIARRFTAVTVPATNNERNERGDVPGWVLVTLMTALLVAGLLALAWPALQALLTQALDGLSL